MKEINFTELLIFLEENCETEIFKNLQEAIKKSEENPNLDLEIEIPKYLIRRFFLEKKE